MRTKYEIVYEDDGVIAIIQTDPSVMSITNDAEAVIADLEQQKLLSVKTAFESTDGLFMLPSPRRVIYKDTEGRWDELVHRFGEFKNYKFIGAKKLGEALNILKSSVS